MPLNTDFLLTDAPVGLGREAVAAIRSAQELLLAAKPDIASMSDGMKTCLVAEWLGLTPIGIVLNRVRKEEFELSAEEIEKHTSPFQEKSRKMRKSSWP